MSEILLVGDVGGTWTRLALYDGKLSAVWRRPTRTVSDLGAAVAEFLSECGRKPDASAIGVAGPIDGSRARLTNLDWEADSGCLPQPGILLNDLAAAAHGVGALDPSQHRRICGPAPLANGARVVLGVGTGHGQALWRAGAVVPGEAGHAGFAPEDAELAELAAMIREERGRATIESILSGSGMDALLRFSATRASLGTAAIEALQSLPAARVVAEHAGDDPACARARSLFARALGSEAGNAALRALPAGGVWLVGGVARALVLPSVDAEIQATFCAKPPMSELIRQIPLLVVRDDDVALRGAAVVASQLLH